MADFWDVGQFTETAGGKSRFIKLGYATEKKGGGFYVKLDCLPLPEIDQRNGKVQCQFVITPPKGSYGGGNDRPQEARRTQNSDEIPF